VGLESFESGRVSLIIHFVGVRPERALHPFLKERLLFEIAEFAGSVPPFLVDFFFLGARRRGIFPPEHYSLVGAMSVLETASHFHLHFMHERLGIAYLRFDLTRLTQERAEFPRPPANKGRLVLPLETVPGRAGLFQPRLRFCAISRSRFAQRFLFDQNNTDFAEILSRDPIRFPRCPLLWHYASLPARRDSERAVESKRMVDAACCYGLRQA
jgi:hypothetical protein